MDSKLKLKASLTVEAAFVLPFFIFAVAAFLYFFQIFLLQETIQMAMNEAAKEISQYSCVYQDITEKKEKPAIESPILSSLMEGTLLMGDMMRYLDPKKINSSCVQGGFYGLSFLKSSVLEEDGIIDLICMYRIKIPIPMFSINGFSLVQRVRTRGFVGTETIGDGAHDKEGNQTENEESDFVYITENGSVYHEDMSCSYIKLKIECIVFQEVEKKRNESGGKYKNCQICVKQNSPQPGESVYITKEGDRYHKTLSCSGLKRTVKSIKRSETENKTPCKRCGKKG